MEIYLIRHGQTDYNLKQVVQGRGIDSELNEYGMIQAKAFFEAYKTVPFEKIYFSALKRTKQTVAGFLQLGIPFQSTPELDEIDWGVFEGIDNDPVMYNRYESIIDRWRKGELDVRMDGGESATDLWERQAPFIERLKVATENKILVCSHGRSIRSILCALTGTPLKDMDDFPHFNTTLYKIRREEKGFRILEFNNTDHLNGKV